MKAGALRIRITGEPEAIEEAARRHGLKAYRQRDGGAAALYLTAKADASAVLSRIKEEEEKTANKAE